MMAKHGLRAAASLALSLTAISAQAAPDLAAADARLTELLDKNYPALDALYKDLHQHPELGMQEVRTAGILAQHLRDAGFTVTEKVGGTGVVGLLKNGRSEEHTSELQSLMRISSAVFCLKKKTHNPYITVPHINIHHANI